VSFPPELARGITTLRYGLGTLLGDMEKGRTVPVHQLVDSLLGCRDQIAAGGREVLGLLFRWKVEDYLIDHSLLVALFAMWMAEGMGFSEDYSAEFGLAGLLHDVGLMEIATETLTKSGPLNPVERRKVNQHPLYSARAVARLGTFSERVRGMILEHHERHNGKGYPFGLRGEEISPGGRIMGLADTLAALMADRPYRQAFALRRVLDEIRLGMGMAFPVDLVRSFFDLAGLYPVHTLCLLRDGRTVQISEFDAKEPWNPIVVVLDGRGQGASTPLSGTGSVILRGKWA
jgi:HD-GYP domain-containing protein (c-di-GMP phosphodiesterase class II)